MEDYDIVCNVEVVKLHRHSVRLSSLSADRTGLSVAIESFENFITAFWPFLRKIQ